MVGASEEADFTKDADVATRARVGCSGHFRVAVGVVRIGGVLATTAPEKEDDESKKSQECQNSDYNASDSAPRERVRRRGGFGVFVSRHHHGRRSDSLGDCFSGDGHDASAGDG